MNLNDLIRDAIIKADTESMHKADALLAILRKNHYWPAIQMKKFFDKSGLVLLHNTYKRVDVDHFQALYDECRSVVLDLDAPEGSNVVVSLSKSIPERFSTSQYEAFSSVLDVCEEAHEGTVVFVYEHAGKWYFGTTSCPNINSSRFVHPTKTHGEMFDDSLAKMFPDTASDEVRDKFTSHLDVTKSYAFVLVHHENTKCMDYTPLFGDAYAALVHISTRDRVTMEEEDLTTEPLSSMGVKYSTRYETPSQGIAHVLTNPSTSYGLIVRTNDNKLLKVSSEEVVRREEYDLGNANVWVNLLHVYLLNKRHFHVDDYIREFLTDGLQYPVDSRGREMAPTYIIHTVVCTMRDILYDFYVRTTTFNPTTVRFRMNKDMDNSLPPIIRFHLAQLRHIQVNDHSFAFLNPKAVYHYIVHHQTMKNIRKLIQHLAEDGAPLMTPRQAECFVTLNNLLSEN
jgi:hypothetical protein